ncbi:MAG: TIGR01777 family oxidoreductase [Candidatus Zixiibacteriota bacterium]
MRILISGATGLIGSALMSSLTRDGHDVVRLVRSDPHGNDLLWDPYTGILDTSTLNGLDAVIHLAGRSIAGGRWTEPVKRDILTSRTVPTTFLAEQMARLKQPPRLFLSASAVGYYGDRGEETLTESSKPGSGFLSEVCTAWEKATSPARDAGIRTINLRIGVVLSTKGGALKEMLTPMKFGLGGKMGTGRQYWSWITLEDLVGAMRFAIDDDSLNGPVNAVSPNAVTNAEFTSLLARVLHRPAIFSVPEFALNVMLGEMARPLLLASARVIPSKLTNAGFAFQSSDLEPALRSVLGS